MKEDPTSSSPPLDGRPKVIDPWFGGAFAAFTSAGLAVAAVAAGDIAHAPSIVGPRGGNLTLLGGAVLGAVAGGLTYFALLGRVRMHRSAVGLAILAATAGCVFGALLPSFVLGARWEPRFGEDFPIWTYYGLGMFTALPFATASFAGWLTGRFFGLTRRAAGFAGVTAILIDTLLLFFAGFEGAVCILMAMPLILPIAALGGCVGHSLATRRSSRAQHLGLALPILGLATVHAAVGWSGHEVRTQFVVNAPPSEVWPYVIQIDELPPPDWWLFRAGAAYPTSIHADAPVLGSRRECRLSTGVMPELIDEFEPDHRLGFRVLATPPTMVETNPFGPVFAPHLVGSYECLHGEFLLTPLSNGRTLITATSRYRQRMAPDAYWSMWSDAVVHQVHLRVLREIARRTERRR